jgi:hypothetical protein
MWKIKVALKIIFIKLFKKATNILPDNVYIKILYLITFWKWPNILKPRTFNEHIIRLKISDDSLKYHIYTDKYEVRDYVSQRIGSEYLNTCYGVYNSFKEIDFSKLPDKFVIKATHGSGYNKIYLNKSKINYKKNAKYFERCIQNNYYYDGREKKLQKYKTKISS